MSRVRVFYGRNGVVAPHGFGRGAVTPPVVDDAPEVADTASADALDEVPDETWKVPALDAFAKAHGIPVEGKKAEKLATILAALADEGQEDKGDDDDDDDDDPLAFEVVYDGSEEE